MLVVITIYAQDLNHILMYFRKYGLPVMSAKAVMSLTIIMVVAIVIVV